LVVWVEESFKEEQIRGMAPGRRHGEMMHSRKMNEVIGGKQYLAATAILIALLATLFFSACAGRELASEDQQLKFQSPSVQMNAGKPQMMMQMGGQYPISPRRSPFPYYPYAPSQPLGDD
jgi:hypothetical protein